MLLGVGWILPELLQRSLSAVSFGEIDGAVASVS